MGINAVVAAWRGVAILLLGEGRMTQDEVLQTLRKVIAESDNFTTWTVSTPHLVELVKRAVEAEREACAKVCEEMRGQCWAYDHDTIAAAIRARGQA